MTVTMSAPARREHQPMMDVQQVIGIQMVSQMIRMGVIILIVLLSMPKVVPKILIQMD